MASSSSWKQSLSLLHKKTSPEEKKEHKEHFSSSSSSLSSSSVEKGSSARGSLPFASPEGKATRQVSTRDRELDAMGIVDPAATMFGGSTPSSKVSSKPDGIARHHSAPVTPGHSYFESHYEDSDVSMSSSKFGQHPVWDNSLFHPSPMPSHNKDKADGDDSTMRSPSGGIIDIDFRRHSNTKENGDGQSVMTSERDDDVNLYTPSREKGPGSRRNSLQDDSYVEGDSFNDDYSGESSSLNPAETSYNIDDGRDVFQTNISDSEPAVGNKVNKMLNFGASIDCEQSGISKGPVSDSVNESRMNASCEDDLEQQSLEGISTTDTVCILKSEQRAHSHGYTAKNSSDDCHTPVKSGDEQHDCPQPKSDVSPESGTLRQMEQAAELKHLVSENKIKKKVSPTTVEDIERESSTQSQSKGHEKAAGYKQASAEITPSKSAPSSEHTLSTPSSNYLHVKPAIVPESPFVPSQMSDTKDTTGSATQQTAGISHSVQSNTNSNLSNKNAKASAGVGDEWKEAKTAQGKVYFYNRRTRVSAWKLPPNAIYIRSGESSYRIFVPAEGSDKSADKATASTTDHAASQNPRSDSSKQPKSVLSSAPKQGYDTPPRSKPEKKPTSSHANVSSHHPHDLTTPPRKPARNTEAEKTPHYSPTGGLMSTPTHSTGHTTRPVTSSPGVAFLKRGEKHPRSNVKMSATVNELQSTRENKSNNQQDDEQLHHVFDRDVPVTPVRSAATGPYHTTSKIVSRETTQSSSSHAHASSYDGLEHGGVFRQSDIKPSPHKESADSQCYSSFASEGTINSSGMFRYPSDLFVHCPLCGDGVSVAANASNNSGTTNYQFDSKKFKSHILQCTSGQPELRRMSSILSSLNEVVVDTIKSMDGNQGDSANEKPLPCSSVIIDKASPAHLKAGSDGRHDGSPCPETSLGSLGSSEAQILDNSLHRGDATVDSNEQPDDYIRHHPRAHLSMKDPHHQQQSYSQIYHKRQSSPGSTHPPQSHPHPAVQMHRDDREILSSATVPVSREQHKTIESSKQAQGTTSTTPANLYVCPCCQLSTLKSREELLSHMRTCVTYSYTPLEASKPASGGKPHHGGNDSKFEGQGHAQAACPFCGKPSTKSALSAHLLSCQKRKASKERRMLPQNNNINIKNGNHSNKDMTTPQKKEKLPNFSPRKRTPLSAVSSNQRHPSHRDADESSVVSGVSNRSRGSATSSASRLSAVSSASTVVKNSTYTSPMIQRMKNAINENRQQQNQRGYSPYQRRKLGSPSPAKTLDKTGQRTVVPFR